ncbi:MAG: RNA polymerase sigma factor [Bacteroidales bacterium]
MTPQEFNIVVSKLRPRLINFASGFVKDGASTADDMVQEAIIKLWKSNEIQEVRNPEALTMHILKNVCLDYLKLKKNSMESLNPNFRIYTDSDPSSSIERKDEVCSINSYLSILPNDQMIAVRLRDIMGYEMEEIAKILDTTEGNVRTLLSRARQKLREKLLADGKDKRG